MDCFWALHIKASLYPNNFFSYISMCYSYPCSPNCPCTLFVDRSFFVCFSLVFLSYLGSTVSSFFIVALLLTATSNSSRLFLTYHPSPFSLLFPLFPHPISPLQLFFVETFNRATSLLGGNSLFIVINFLVFLSISCSSLLFH